MMGLRTFTVGLCIAASALSAPALAAVAAPTTTFTSLTVFGDSLVDAGNILALTGGTTPSASAGYFQGRFTNGYDYTDLLSIDLFGSPTKASALGGNNFAFGGARATSTTGVPDLQEQLALFSASKKAIDPTGLYVLNFGGNDIFGALAPGAPTGFVSDQAFLQQAASIYAGGIQTLANLGAQNFLITGFPVAGPGLTLSLQAEGFLTGALASLNLGPDVNLYRYSYLDFFQRVTTNPAAFGLPSNLNTTTTCQAAQALPDCTGYFYFDNTHPTAAIQRAAYQDINRQFGLSSAGVPEPTTWIMMLLGFGAVGYSMRSRKVGYKAVQAV
jgi:phospholipase/lecithinase/hemolysin